MNKVPILDNLLYYCRKFMYSIMRMLFNAVIVTKSNMIVTRISALFFDY